MTFIANSFFNGRFHGSRHACNAALFPHSSRSRMFQPVQFLDPRVGFQGQLQLDRRRPSCLRVELLAHRLGPFPLPADFPVQRGCRELHPGQVRQPLGRLLYRHLAGQQRRQFLHRRPSTGTVLQPQHRVGRKTPLAAATTPAVRVPQGHRPEATAEGALLGMAPAGEPLAPDRVAGRGGVGFDLGADLDGTALQFPVLAQ